jgi:hypothetical protein
MKRASYRALFFAWFKLKGEETTVAQFICFDILD